MVLLADLFFLTYARCPLVPDVWRVLECLSGWLGCAVGGRRGEGDVPQGQIGKVAMMGGVWVLLVSLSASINISEVPIVNHRKQKNVTSLYCCRSNSIAGGSRLTAYELVHEKMSATLIVDSAVVALMKAGRVDAVIVGAYRVAANGDTANKIRTYSLALLASRHKIPFYVAAPVTSIDLSLSTGDQIIIEERSAGELLYSEGGLGKQVAASGIDVWNLAFDVTPASLNSGITTEKLLFSRKRM